MHILSPVHVTDNCLNQHKGNPGKDFRKYFTIILNEKNDAESEY